MRNEATTFTNKAINNLIYQSSKLVEQSSKNKLKHSNRILTRLVSWSSGNAFVSGAGGLRFKPQAKFDPELPTARHRCDISSKEAVLLELNHAEMGLANV